MVVMAAHVRLYNIANSNSAQYPLLDSYICDTLHYCAEMSVRVVVTVLTVHLYKLIVMKYNTLLLINISLHNMLKRFD